MSTELINRITVKKDGVYVSSHSSNDTSGCRGQIENAFYHKARCRAVNGTEFVLYSPDLKCFLASGCYIGRVFLPKSK